ncbi:MAG: GlxA family transcriptional regulator [Paracoccaceae bacterium]
MTNHSPILANGTTRPNLLALVEDATENFAFLLLEGFSHLALASALEPLRHANQCIKAPAYGWRMLSETGAAVTCSNGLTLQVQGGLAELGRSEILIVVGGPGTGQKPYVQLCHTLRRIAVHGTRIGAFCEGVHVLARVGLLQDQECAVHWASADSFAEQFPDLRVSRSAFVMGRRPMAVGGAVASDLMLHMIADRFGADLAARIADLMVCNGVRTLNAEQTMSLQSRYGMRNPRLLQVLRSMEDNLETPLTALEISEAANLSMRQTERLFRRYVKMTPMAFYLKIRVERAHNLLAKTELGITEIAMACGFESKEQFVRRYRSAYGVTPRYMRAVGGAVAKSAAEPPQGLRRAG